MQWFYLDKQRVCFLENKYAKIQNRQKGETISYTKTLEKCSIQCTVNNWETLVLHRQEHFCRRILFALILFAGNIVACLLNLSVFFIAKKIVAIFFLFELSLILNKKLLNHVMIIFLFTFSFFVCKLL